LVQLKLQIKFITFWPNQLNNWTPCTLKFTWQNILHPSVSSSILPESWAEYSFLEEHSALFSEDVYQLIWQPWPYDSLCIIIISGHYHSNMSMKKNGFLKKRNYKCAILLIVATMVCPCGFIWIRDYILFTDMKMIPIENHGVRCMSIGFLVDKDAPIVWRGPMVCLSMCFC